MIARKHAEERKKSEGGLEESVVAVKSEDVKESSDDGKTGGEHHD